jgi:serine/threonine-protein kinase
MSWDIPIGTEFAGYRITGVIGHGGMSVVYTAEHLSLGRVVALKVLSPGLASDDEFRERFVRESKLAATLEHPNIIPIYDAGEAEGLLYIAMRHVNGGDLGALIKAKAPLGLGQTIYFIEQVGGALDHAHRQGLVHRDVKPANVLVETPSDRVYLTDFGVVKQTSTAGLTKTGYFLGTFAYAAPEQIERKPVDGRTDLYALGCVLHECLSGRPPFDAVTEASMLHAHLVEPPPRLTDVRPDLPHAIDDVIATALAKAKEDRYASCAELVRALRAVSLGTSVEPPPVVAASRVASETVLAPSGTPVEPAPPAPPVATPPAPAAPAEEPAVAAAAVATAPASERPSQPESPVPPPADTRAPGTVTLTRKWLAIIGVGVLVLIAGAVGAAVALTGGDDGDGTSAAGTTTSGTQSMTFTGLEGVVPNALFKFCEESTPDPGAAETATCAPTADATGAYYPDSWQFSTYKDGAAAAKAYNDLRSANDIGQDFGRCNATQWGGEGAWLHGPDKPGGRQFCYFEGNVAVIVWTHEKLGQETHIDMIGIARSKGGDHANLFNWYRFWHHRVGKCDAVGCVAEI